MNITSLVWSNLYKLYLNYSGDIHLTAKYNWAPPDWARNTIGREIQLGAKHNWTQSTSGREIQLGAKLNWARNTTGRETQLTANHNWAPNTIRREKLGAKYNWPPSTTGREAQLGAKKLGAKNWARETGREKLLCNRILVVRSPLRTFGRINRRCIFLTLT